MTGLRKVCPPGRQALHGALRRYVPLIHVTAALEPRALQQLQQQVRGARCVLLFLWGTRRRHAAWLHPPRACARTL
jgi:hypothetical protein